MLMEYALPRRRSRSAGKATWPGRKQVWRRYGADGRMAGDIVSVESDEHAGEPLIQLVMQGGRRGGAVLTVSERRARAAGDLDRLPNALRRLEPDGRYPVQVADALIHLAA